MNQFLKCQTVTEYWQGTIMKIRHNAMGESQWIKICNKSIIKLQMSNQDINCWPCLSVNVKAKNYEKNSSNDILWNRSGGGRQRPVEREQPVDSSQVEIFVIFTILFKLLQPIIISKLQNTKLSPHLRGWRSKQRKATYDPDYKATMNRQGR